MEKVLITGGTGLIGRILSKKLLDKGYEVAILSRSPNTSSDIPVFHWNYETGKIDQQALNYCDYIIHLAGSNIGEKRWTKRRKQLILDSRIKSADFIYKTLEENNIKPKAFVSASAIGYYGSLTSERIFVEDDDYHKDFLGKTCKLWEQAADDFQDRGIRSVKIRTGIVFTKKDGPLAKMMTSFKFRLGAILGNGKQYVPWIHVDDLCEIYIKAIEDSNIKGAYNAVAPEHITYSELVRGIALFVKRPFITMRVPGIFIKIIFGRMSEILLNGSRISSKKIQQAGFKFRFPSIQEALAELINKDRN
jgi:uncharacterized protein (TIGR01777 family)